MGDSTVVSGRTQEWREQVFSHGLIIGDTKVNISMTKRKAKECSTGLMAGNMKEIGRMENNMELECTHQHQASRGRDSGLKERECMDIVIFKWVTGWLN